ncbi:MAG: tRNA-guanine transglycosylase, partial [Planctomycetota bacterium]
GHGMGDVEKGRIYRIAPKGSQWSVPAVVFTSAAGLAAALASPNPSTRATALERLAKQPDAASDELTRARLEATDPRFRARLAWALSILPGKAAQLPLLLAKETEEMQIVALRMQRLLQGDVVSLVEKLAASPSEAVRRECVIALRGIPGEQADRIWAELAFRHQAGDRWEVEALGIGADSVSGFDGESLWNGRLGAWLAKMGHGWKSPAGREIVWQSRAAATPALLCELIGDPSTTTSESLALVRALDFQSVSGVRDAVRPLVKALGGPDDKVRVVLPELIARLDKSDIADADLAKRVDEAVEYVAGTQAFVTLVGQFQLKDRVGELLTLTAAEGAPKPLAASAVQAAFALGGADSVKQKLMAGDGSSKRLLMALSIRGDRSAIGMLKGVLSDPSPALEFKSAAITALSRSNQGAKELVAMDFGGYAIGGVSVGEPEPEMMKAVDYAEPFLPTNKARYAMGLGTPAQMVELVARGVDLFDCVLPTRVARNGTAFTRKGTVSVKAGFNKSDF